MERGGENIYRMFDKIKFFSKSDHDKIVAALHIKISELEKKNLVLEAENVSLKKEEKSVIDISLGDPIPSESDQRKQYVGKVAGFFKDVLKPKLYQMISVAHNILEERDSDREFDMVLKGAIFAYRDIIRWGEAMINEQLSYQSQDDSKSEIKELKEQLKEE